MTHLTANRAIAAGDTFILITWPQHELRTFNDSPLGRGQG